jgi:hypothetical protein
VEAKAWSCTSISTNAHIFSEWQWENQHLSCHYFLLI